MEGSNCLEMTHILMARHNQNRCIGCHDEGVVMTSNMSFLLGMSCASKERSETRAAFEVTLTPEQQVLFKKYLEAEQLCTGMVILN